MRLASGELPESENADRERWNRLYRERSHRSLDPDASLVAAYEQHIAPQVIHRSGMAALDLAGGVGRNALWLARRGWRVTLNELSDEAARLAAENAAQAGLPLRVCCEPAAETLSRALAEGVRYDLILLLYFLERSLFPVLVKALAPGGFLYLKTRTVDHPRFRAGSHHPEYYLERNELAGSFPKLLVVHAREEGGTAELLARQDGAEA